MKSRASLLFIVTVLLLIGVESAPLKAADGPRSPDYTIAINGISGKVTHPIEVVRPKELVEVKVCPADLINYEYTIEKTKEEKLQEGFSIVGVGPVFDLVSGRASVALEGAIDLKGGECAKVKEDDLLTCYKVLRQKIKVQQDEVKKAVADVEAVSSGRALYEKVDCDQMPVKWPAEITKMAALVNGKPAFHATYKAQSDVLGDLEKDRQMLVARIEDEQLQPVADGKTANALLGQLSTALEAIKGPIAALQNILDNARDLTDRWANIISDKEPKVVQTFLMAETSARVTIGVKRKPLTPKARKDQDLTEADPTKIQPIQFATTTFENRAWHRFNISMGMVGVGRSDNKDFEVASSLGADGNTAYHIRESKRDEVEFEAATFLGIYFKQVDNYDPERPAAWMVMLGTEISASPSDFFLGLGRDTRQGVVFGFGVTEYEGVSPGKGWKVGQEVPAITGTGADAGKPKVATIPKEKKDTLGAYLFVGFRPSIFKAFLDRRK